MTTRPLVPTGGRVSFWQPGQGGLRVPRPPLRDGLPLRDIWARKKLGRVRSFLPKYPRGVRGAKRPRLAAPVDKRGLAP